MRQSFEPTYWGPHAWYFIHAAVLSLPDGNLAPDEQKRIFNFFDALSLLLPCTNCRDHYSVYFQKHKLDPSNKESIWLWLNALHNEVNIRNGKQSIPPTDAKRIFYDEYNTQGKATGNSFAIVGLILVVVIFMYAYVKSRR